MYVILHRNIPAPKTPYATLLLSKTGFTMVTSGFGPYHGQGCGDTPTKYIGVIPIPWMMTHMLGFIDILQAHE